MIRRKLSLPELYEQNPELYNKAKKSNSAKEFISILGVTKKIPVMVYTSYYNQVQGGTV